MPVVLQIRPDPRGVDPARQQQRRCTDRAGAHHHAICQVLDPGCRDGPRTVLSIGAAGRCPGAVCDDRQVRAVQEGAQVSIHGRHADTSRRPQHRTGVRGAAAMTAETDCSELRRRLDRYQLGDVRIGRVGDHHRTVHQRRAAQTTSLPIVLGCAVGPADDGRVVVPAIGIVQEQTDIGRRSDRVRGRARPPAA